MLGDEAVFSYYVPVIDAIQIIHGASASLVEVVPEPSSTHIAIVVLLCAVIHSRRHAP
jgi:hypothetical protein